MRILLINPHDCCNETMGRAKRFLEQWLPLGLLSISANLEAGGHDVLFHDCRLRNETVDDAVQVVADTRPDLVGLSCLTATSEFVFRLGRRLKDRWPALPVVLGNVHASIFDEFFLRHGVGDVVVHGEGEAAMRELADALVTGELRGVRGISFFAAGRVVRTEPRPPLMDLGILPEYHFRGLRLQDYSYFHRRKKMLPIMSSRGCVNRCRFCGVHEERCYRVRPVEAVVEEMARYQRDYGVEKIYFLDSLLTASAARVTALCEEMHRRGVSVPWQGCGHFNYISEALVKTMARAGCVNIVYGIESGSQGLLDAMAKRTTLAQIREIVGYSARHLHGVEGTFMLGVPGETPDTIRETIALACSLPLRTVQFSLFIPYPGSDYYRELVAAGALTEDLADVEATLARWRRYSSYTVFTGRDPVYVAPGFSARELLAWHKKAIRAFYARPGYLWRYGLTTEKLSGFDFRSWRDLRDLFSLVGTLYR